MQLLEELHDKGFQVSVVNGDTLKIIPGSKLTPELAQKLRDHKPELLKIIQWVPYLGKVLVRYFGVYLCSLQITVPQKFLYVPYVSALL